MLFFLLHRSPFDNSAQRDTEALILDTIKSAVRFQKNIGDAWIKVVFFRALDLLKVLIYINNETNQFLSM